MDVGGWVARCGLADEHEELRRLATRVAEECRRQGPSGQRERARLLADRGLLAWLAPVRFGGRLPGERPDPVALSVIRESLGTHSPELDGAFVSQALGLMPILLWGSAAQKERYVRGGVSGSLLGALAITEPGAGSDMGAIRTGAMPDGDGFVLDGEKRFITGAPHADFLVVCARTEPGGGGSSGLSAFVLDAPAPGLTVTPRPMLSPHPTGDVILSGCRVPRGSLLGSPGDGFRIAAATLEVLRPTVGAFAVGLAQRALDLAVERARERVQFGRPLAEFQAIRFKLADMATRLKAARLMVYSAAAAAAEADAASDPAADPAATRGRSSGAGARAMAGSMAKLFATEAAFAVVDQAVQIFGGEGVTQGSEVERLFREARPPLIYEGASEIQRLIIARAILGG